MTLSQSAYIQKTLDAIYGTSPTEYFYGCAFSDDYLLRNPESLPRFGHLARKVMMHYAGEAYNPHTHGLMHEVHIRSLIKDVIDYKLLYRTPGYDWEWLDHCFKRYFSRCFNLDLSYDEAFIEAGPDPKYLAKAHVNSSVIN